MYGLLTDESGEPIAVEVFQGNTKDNKTVNEQIHKIKEQFGCQYVTLVGDKGMLKTAEIEDLQENQFNYITSITKAQIKTLLKEGVSQMSLFDREICEVEDQEKAVRYIYRRNPYRAEEIRANRQSKIEYIKSRIEKSNEYLTEHSRAKLSIQERNIKNLLKKMRMDGYIKLSPKRNRAH